MLPVMGTSESLSVMVHITGFTFLCILDGAPARHCYTDKKKWL